MKALRVLRMVRQKEKDNDEVKFSDYDIREAVNEVLRYLNVSLANKGSEHLQKVATFDQNELNATVGQPYWVSPELYNSEIELYDSDEPLWGEYIDPRYDFAAKGLELPRDYVSLVDIRRPDGYPLKPATSLGEIRSPWGDRKYIILGGRIYVKSEAFRICYYCALQEVQDFDEDDIDLPDIYLDPVVKLTRMVLNNADVDTMTQAVNTAVDRAVPRRRYTNMRQRMPFRL